MALQLTYFAEVVTPPNLFRDKGNVLKITYTKINHTDIKFKDKPIKNIIN
jgi:hypothetical protein